MTGDSFKMCSWPQYLRHSDSHFCRHVNVFICKCRQRWSLGKINKLVSSKKSHGLPAAIFFSVPYKRYRPICLCTNKVHVHVWRIESQVPLRRYRVRDASERRTCACTVHVQCTQCTVHCTNERRLGCSFLPWQNNNNITPQREHINFTYNSLPNVINISSWAFSTSISLILPDTGCDW